MRSIPAIGLSCLILLTGFSGAASAQEANSLETAAEQVIILDYDTNTVLFEKNADERMPTSSMSKVLTGYAVSEALKRGDVSLTDTCRVSEKAWRMQGSKMFVQLDSDISIENLLRGVIIQSGNDATIVLAECLSGSEASFAVLLNDIAKDLGMEHSHFVNASGWPDENHYSTARDLATLGVAIIRDHPNEYKMYKEIDFTYNGIKQGNRNPLLYKNIGVDGIKTGHTEAAGYGLMASAVRDGRRVVMVANGMNSMQERSDEGVKLITWALMNFKNDTVIEKNEAIKTVPVLYGKTDTLDLIAGNSLIITRPTTERGELKTALKVTEPVEAPIKKGDKVGEMDVTLDDGSVKSVPVLAAHSVEEAPFYKKIWQKITVR